MVYTDHKNNLFTDSLYANKRLAEYAVLQLSGRMFSGKQLDVVISDRAMDLWRSGGQGLVLGQSRWGEDLWRTPS